MFRISPAILLGLTSICLAQATEEPLWEIDLPVLRKAVEADPENLGLRLRLANVLLRRDPASAHPDEARKRLLEARAQFSAILAKNPKAREPLRALVIESYTRRQHEDVIKNGKKLLSEVIVDADVTLWVLRAMVRLKKRAEVAEFFVSWVGSGTVRSRGEVQGFMVGLVGDREQAKLLENALSGALSKEPENVNLLLYQSVYLAQAGRNVESWKVFHKAERLGLCGLSTGHRHAFARELLDRSIEPDEGPGSYADTRLDLLKAKLEKAPDHAGLAMRIARILDTSGKNQEALPYYERVCKANPKLWSSVYRRAQILADQEEFEKAIPLYRRVLQLSPAFEAGRLRLAYALARTGAFDESRETLKTFASSFAPEKITRKILDEFGKKQGVLGKYCEALAADVAEQPGNPYLRCQLALALHKNGAKAEARAEAMKAERLGLAGILGHPHPIVFEVFDKPVQPSSKDGTSGRGR